MCVPCLVGEVGMQGHVEEAVLCVIRGCDEVSTCMYGARHGM